MTAERLPAPPADDRATSSTVGAVLMVAITVLLATAAGTQFLNLTGGQGGAYATPGVDYSASDNRVTVTWLANTNAENLDVRIMVDDDRRTVVLHDVGDRVAVDGDGVTVSASGVTHLDSPAISDGDRVSVTVVAVADNESVVVARRTGRV